MCNELLNIITSISSVLAALFSASCAIMSFRLARRIYREAKSDENVIASNFSRPNLQNNSHSESVITCNLFNCSKRKAYISSVKLLENGNQVSINWSSAIDEYGNPQRPNHTIGIVDLAYLFIRKTKGKEIDNCIIEIYHSLSSEPIVCDFDFYAFFP